MRAVPNLRPLAAAIVMVGLLSGPATASDDDSKPDSDSWDIEIGEAYGKTIVINAWDTINFVNSADQDFSVVFLAGSDPLSEDDPASLQPTRPRGTYWDGTSVLNSGKLGKGASYWVIPIEKGRFEFYNLFNPEQRGWVVSVPETKHINNEGKPFDDATIAADASLKELVEATR